MAAAAADDASSIVALLRGLRSSGCGAVVDVNFVHRVDVCSAAPAALVADLAPVPGTDVADGGYRSVWYFYCPKRYKNVRGKPSGHRQRAIAGGGDTCWHSETRPRPVKGLDGATSCNLSFGRKEEGSGRSFNRMGWCMTEYDDDHGGGGDHVLCKVYRSSSSLAKGKLKASSSSSSSSINTAASSEHSSSSSKTKRKATADHQQAPPTKISHTTTPAADQEYHHFQEYQEKFMDLLQEQGPFLIGEDQCTFTLAELWGCPDPEYGGVPTVDPRPESDTFAVDDWMPDQEHHVGQTSGAHEELEKIPQQQGGEPEQGGQFIKTPYGQVPSLQFQVSHFSVDDLLGPTSDECCSVPAAMGPPDASFFENLERFLMSDV